MFVNAMSYYSISIALISFGVFNCYAFDIDNDVVFRLYTHENPVEYWPLKIVGSPAISNSPFNPKRPTRIFVHGYQSSESVLLRYRDAYLNLGDFNFIAVDWTLGASTYNYLTARGYVQRLSERLADIIDTLWANGMKLEDVTMVGHSLGAHIAGRSVRKLLSYGKINCIVGLDPAGVGFSFFDLENRLTKSDADYVQIIHTDTSNFGMLKPFGHADFYPNGGRKQPGCESDCVMLGSIECSHVRAHYLFLESLSANFTAIHCESFNDFKNGRCVSTLYNATALMGGDITPNTPKPHGIFYLETNAASPFSIDDYQSYNKFELILTSWKPVEWN